MYLDIDENPRENSQITKIVEENSGIKPGQIISGNKETLLAEIEDLRDLTEQPRETEIPNNGRKQNPLNGSLNQDLLPFLSTDRSRQLNRPDRERILSL